MIIFMCIGYDLASFDHMKTIELAHKAICGDFGSNCLVPVFYFRCINIDKSLTIINFYNCSYFVVVWLYIVWLNIVWPLFRSVPGLGNPWIYRLDHSCNCKSLYNGNKTHEPNNSIQNRHKSPYEQVWWFSYGQMMLNHNQYI